MNDRTDHMDLLDQVERDQATRDAVRRMLAEPLPITRETAFERWERQPWPIAPANYAHRHSKSLTEAEIAALVAQRQADVLAAIDARAPKCQACARGAKPCQTPDACYIAEQAADAGVTLRAFWNDCTPGAKIGVTIVGAITVASLVWHVVARMA